jgi:RNA polymerase primary sigma factor
MNDLNDLTFLNDSKLPWKGSTMILAAPYSPTQEPNSLRQTTRELAAAEIQFIDNPAFRKRSPAGQIMDAVPRHVDSREASWRPGKNMPPHLAQLCAAKLLKPAEETALFRRMNYCKYSAELLRRKLNPSRPSSRAVTQIQELLAQATADRDWIVQANLRLVISIAKKFATAQMTFEDLLSEGIASLLRAVEKFDFDRGFRFSTYATQAIRRSLCRQLQTAQRESRRFVAADPLLLADDRDSASTLTLARWEELRKKLKRLLSRLDPRERSIIRRRFGLDQECDVQTLQSLAEDLGVCKERVRQLEMRAIAKLRTFAERVKLTPLEA